MLFTGNGYPSPLDWAVVGRPGRPEGGGNPDDEIAFWRLFITPTSATRCPDGRRAVDEV
jgi:hypothetical protein